MARKRKTTEATTFDVEMVDNKPIQQGAQKVTKTVSAATRDEALRKATQGDPNTGKYEQITLKQKPTTPGPVVNKPQTAMTTEAKGKKKSKKVDPNTMEFVESVRYPYSLMLPKAFQKLIEGAVSTKANAVLTESYGRVYVRIEDKAAMVAFVENLHKSKDEKAKVVVEGIKRSIR